MYIDLRALLVFPLFCFGTNCIIPTYLRIGMHYRTSLVACLGVLWMGGRLISLSSLPLGNQARVRALKSVGAVRRRMLDLGLIENTLVIPLHKSPSGDPVAYLIRGAVIALRLEDASKILVEP